MADTLTKEDVILLIKKENDEMYKCFNQLTKDLTTLKKGQARLERALLGDKDFEDKGLVSMVNQNYEYVKRNIDNNHVIRTDEVISHYERWEKDKKWDLLNEIMDKYQALKWLTALIIGSGIISVAQLGKSIIEWVSTK